MLSALIAAALLLPTPLEALSPSLIAHAAEIDAKTRWRQELAWCESQGNDNAAVVDTNGYWSRGRYQWQLASWLRYSKLFGTSRENIFNPDLQEAVTTYVLETKGWGDWYNCGKKVQAKLGPYPI